LKWATKWTNGRLNLNPRKIQIITIVYVVQNQMEKITGKRICDLGNASTERMRTPGLDDLFSEN
jgi:hypothetical protein